MNDWRCKTTWHLLGRLTAKNCGLTLPKTLFWGTLNPWILSQSSNIESRGDNKYEPLVRLDKLMAISSPSPKTTMRIGTPMTTPSFITKGSYIVLESKVMVHGCWKAHITFGWVALWGDGMCRMAECGWRDACVAVHWYEVLTLHGTNLLEGEGSWEERLGPSCMMVLMYHWLVVDHDANEPSTADPSDPSDPSDPTPHEVRQFPKWNRLELLNLIANSEPCNNNKSSCSSRWILKKRCWYRLMMSTSAFPQQGNEESSRLLLSLVSSRVRASNTCQCESECWGKD